MATHYSARPNWFAASWFGQFMASGLGRAVRIIGGAALIGSGLLWIGGTEGYVVAAIGLGGLLAYAVARRTNEIGVRMALGAARVDVVRMILRDATRMAGLGILIGLPAAYGVSRFLEASLFELDPVDPLSVAFALAVLLLVALTAAWLPARRAAGVSPVAALREE